MVVQGLEFAAVQAEHFQSQMLVALEIGTQHGDRNAQDDRVFGREHGRQKTVTGHGRNQAEAIPLVEA